MAQSPYKSELIAELARARGAATSSLHGLRDDLDLKRRLESTFRRHSAAWIAGAGILGLLLAKLPARRRKVKGRVKPVNDREPEKVAVKAGLLLTVAKLAFDIARPALTRWITGRVTDYAATRFSRGRGG